jgi:anthranilate phosphoribosyltransferase
MEKVLNKVVNKIDLTEEEMIDAMTDIMEGKIGEAQMAAFLTALRMKGESVEEITGGAKVMREKADKIDLGGAYGVDTCGTGGDGSDSYNISTASTFILAATGIKVVKHGNRSVSSKSGSADVLEALGADITLKRDAVKECVDKCGLGFFFAPNFHSAMKHAIGVRKSLKMRTIFNMLGPLTNPAGAGGQVLGVFDAELTETIAKVLKNLGLERAMVVHGMDKMDEISISDKTKVSELKDGEIKTYYIEPEYFGMKKASKDSVKGGDSAENAEIIKAVLKGEITGPMRDILVLNSGAGLYVGKKVESLADGIKMAGEIIDSGKAYAKLEEFIGTTKEVGAK